MSKESFDPAMMMMLDGDSRLVHVLKLVYRKHTLNDDSIGWCEMQEKVFDLLCDTIGDEAFCEWRESMDI